MTAKNAQRCLAILLALVMSAAASAVQAADYYARTGGAGVITADWNLNTTWTASATCVGAALGVGVFPGAADNVFICSGKTVNVTAAHAALSVTFLVNTPAGGLGSNLTHTGAFTLTVGAGGVTINGSSAANGTRAWNINTGTGNVAGPVTLVAGSTNARIARINLTTGTLDVNNNLAMTNAAADVRTVIAATGAANIRVAGSFTLSSTFGTLTPGGTSTFTFDRGTTPVTAATSGAGGLIQYRNLTINKAAAAQIVNAATTGNLTVLGALAVTRGVFNIQGITSNVTGTTTVSSNGTLGFTTATTGTKTFGAVTINGGAPLGIWNNALNEDITLNGTFTNNGTFTAGTGIYTFSGAAAQNIAGAVASTFQNVTINKTAAANTVSVAGGTPSPTVNGTLTLTMGQLVTSGAACPAAQPIILGTAGVTAGGSANSYVRGTLRKNFAIGATLNFRAAATEDEFPVGTAAAYYPIEITAGGTSTAGDLRVCIVATEHPQVATPVTTTGIDTLKSVNRYWSLTSTTLNTAAGVGAALVDATFKFTGLPGPDAGYIDAIAVPANFIVERWNGTVWSPTTAPVGAAGPTSTRAQNINLTAGANHIAIGEPLAGVTALPGEFNAFDTGTTAGAVIGKIQTKIAATAFTVRLVKLNAAKNAIDTAYAQAGVTVELYDASNNGGVLNPTTACRPTWTPIAGTSQAVNFAAGIVNATFTIAMLPNVYRDVRVHVVKAGAGAGEGCSTDRFAIRPQSLATSARDADWETAGITRPLANTLATGGNVHKASTDLAATPRPFLLRATPAPAGAANYDGTPTTVAAFPACIAPPAACVTGTLTYAAVSWVAGAVAGTRENSTANYSEAGVFNMRLEDRTYADVDLVDGSSLATRTVPAAATVSIGRFVPSHFDVSVTVGPPAPVFRTFNTTDGTCSTATAPVRSFTYFGQPFQYTLMPAATIGARNAAGTAISNYTGTLWKIGDLTGGTTPVVTKDCTTDPNICVFNTTWTTASAISNVTETYTYTLAPASTPGWDNAGATGVAASVDTATGNITYATSDTLAFLRNTTTPQGVVTASITDAISVRDTSEAAVLGNGNITTATPASFSNIAFNGADFDTVGGFIGGKTFVYGRLTLGNANGSHFVPLSLLMETQYWNGASFITNVRDHCTTAAAANVGLGNYTGNLAAGETTPSIAAGAFGFGKKTLVMSAPGTGNNGSVDIVLNLGSTTTIDSCLSWTVTPTPAGANLSHLRGRWCGATYTKDPTGRASFGVYKGAEEVIFTRENF